MGIVALRASHALHQTLLIKLDHRLGQIKVNRSAPHPLAIQDLRQLAHQLKGRDQRLVALPHSSIALENQVHIGVSHALRRADHSRHQLIAHHLALVVNFHDAAQHQAINFGPQIADVSRKLHRQHGHRAVREIDRRPTHLRFGIERRLRLNVMGHVGDVHLQLKVAVRQFARGHRVVKVAGGFAVNGYDGQLPEVAPLL